jgi:hypothetical protein
MKTHFSFLFITLFFSLAVAAQKLQVEVQYVTTDPAATKPLIYYTPPTTLTWNDFKGKPAPTSDAASITNAGIGFKMMFRSQGGEATLKITVNCNFSKNDSWVKDDRKIPYILNHEQHHFDIAYIHAMLFIQKLKAANYTMKDYNKVIEKIYYDCQMALLTMQNDYDRETKNSRLADQQELWDKKIDAQMAALKNK